eukprot:GFUD01032067.1.p1 GENE.GFUD01032067.1~~GFUD01032067.1.p1  ORF type:complete len:152 (-),score=31.87 GFUD01032067.1:13-468(-)
MTISKLSFLLLNIFATITANLDHQPTHCAVVYDGGGLTATNLVIDGNVPVRKMAGQGQTTQVSTIIVSRGCVLVGYGEGDKAKEDEVINFGASCTADVLEKSTVIDIPETTIQTIKCFCVVDCQNNSSYKIVFGIKNMILLLTFVMLKFAI